jgi:diguanylate cyclase (GGDEF)-like protein/PAS domain S-box-containing protein
MKTRKPTILVVDDAPLMRRILVEVLGRFGYHVETTEDGQQAIDFFLANRPDLILMDADMPILDGVTACARIRQLPDAKYLPIIIVTAFVGRDWVDRAFAAGATDYVTKPVNWDVLRNRIQYILQAKQSEEALFEEKEKAQITLASIGDGVITTNAQGEIEYLNPIASKLTGWHIDEAKGLPLNQIFCLVDETDKQPIEFPIQLCLTGNIVKLPEHTNTVLIHRDRQHFFAIEDSAAPIKDKQGRIIGVVLVFHDVTENHKMNQQLVYQAKHDALTNLFNRHEFHLRLKSLLNQWHAHDTVQHSLMFLDLDQFKIVNDTCGHEAGDQLLKDVALLLEKMIKHSRTYTQATLARLGGDEFGLLLEDCDLQNAQILANTLCEAIQNLKFYWEDEQQLNGKRIFNIGVSIGLVPISAQTVNDKSLLAMADAACYAAKNAGRNNVHVYKDTDLIDEIEWVSLLNYSLESNDGFKLFYQPIVKTSQFGAEVKTEIWYEVLLRMHTPKGHIVPPGAFLSTATRYTLTASLDKWVVNACIVWLQRRELSQFKLLNLNISGHSLNDKTFVNSLVERLSFPDVPAHKLCFEITEATAITNFSNTVNFMTELRKLGCHFALDDFGSGMSSFSYLKNLPVDFIKIDGRFIKGIVTDKIDFAVVKSINEIAHEMNLCTIAEFVETEEIFQHLQAMNVDYVQGYWIGKPQPLPL